MGTPKTTPEGDGPLLNDNIRDEAERLFRALLRYCTASRNRWWQLSKDEQRDYFPPIFQAALRLEDLFCRIPVPGLRRRSVGADSISDIERGRELIRGEVGRMVFQYRQGVECIVAGVPPADFDPEAEVKRPDFRPFLSPLREALELMGSEVATATPVEAWWNEPVKPDPLNPMFADMHQIRNRADNEQPETTPKPMTQRRKRPFGKKKVEQHWREVMASGDEQLIEFYLTAGEVELAKRIETSRNTLRGCECFQNREQAAALIRRENNRGRPRREEL